MSVQSCSLPDRTVKGLGPIAKFDPLSKNSECKRLYNEGSAYERSALVQNFCNRFKSGNIPERCRCYRFKDTPDFQKYRSLWQDLLDTEKTGEGDNPLVGSYTCFYEGCTADPDVYKTSRMEANGRSCPSVVYCKQQFGDISIETTGKSLGDINLEIEQRCGMQEEVEDDTNGEGRDDDVEANKQKDINPMYVWGGVALLIVILALAFLALKG